MQASRRGATQQIAVGHFGEVLGYAALASIRATALVRACAHYRWLHAAHRPV